MEKIRAGHMEMLADVRENYQSELARAKAEMERTFGDVRQADSLDLSRMKENFTVRYVSLCVFGCFFVLLSPLSLPYTSNLLFTI